MASFKIGTKFTAKDGVSPVLRNLGRSLNGFEKKVARARARSTGFFASVGKIGAGIIGANLATRAVQGLGNQISSLVKNASQIENVEAAFTPLMGSAIQAKKLVGELNATAATTPFQFESISKSANQLLPVMNGDIARTVSTFRMLGDTAGGNAQKLDSITRGFTKAMLKNKVDMESLNMIAEAGVPIYTELAKSMGVSVATMADMSSKGQISSKALTQTFKAMTSEGGIFFKGMQIASKTLSGLTSTLSDNINLTKAAVGQALLPTIKSVVSTMITFAGSFREVIEANKQLIKLKIGNFIQGLKSFGKFGLAAVRVFWKFRSVIAAAAVVLISYKTATLAVLTAQKLMLAALAVGKFIAFSKGIMGVVSAKGLWVGVQNALNIAMTANPIGAIIVGITALIAATALLVIHWRKIISVFQIAWGWIVKVKDSFVDLIGNFLNSRLFLTIRNIGATIFKYFIMPLRTALFLWSKVPGLSALGKGVEIIDNIQSNISNDLSNSKNLQTASTQEINKNIRNTQDVNVNFNNMPEVVTVDAQPANLPNSNIKVNRQ